jgi:hypothetical protein
MTLPAVLGLLALALAAWFIWDSLRVREAANAAMRRACAAQGLLFLDDTVALRSIRPMRDDDGRMRLRRIYAFEFSDTGHDRCKGSITLIGDRILSLDIGLPPAPYGETPEIRH